MPDLPYKMYSQEIKSKIEKLVDELNAHNYDYYVLDKPTISDYEFDNKLKELEELEQQDPSLVLPYSPTQKVGGEPIKNFTTVAHSTPLLSLSNTYSNEEITDFDRRVKELSGEKNAAENTIKPLPVNYVCELKYDGLSISLEYNNGLLTRAITRGDGTKGDDVTSNIRTIKSIPLKLQGSNYPQHFIIRGEVIMPHSSFKELNEKREEIGLEKFANPRNAASGSLKMQDPAQVAERKLDCFLYFLISDEITESLHEKRLKMAQQWGFKTGHYYKVCENLQEINDYINYWDKERKNLPFDTDGVVIKVNQTKLWQTLGFTAKSPRWAIAYKFKAESVATQILSVDFQVGRTGRVTPVANLNPVQLSGSTVQRATLNSEGFISDMDIRVGDTVFVEKGGEIIPKITSVDLTQRPLHTPPFKFRENCPECGTLLVKEENEAIHFCPNRTLCPPQVKGLLSHFVSRKAMDISSLGDERIELLYNTGKVRNIADFYDLKFDDLFMLSDDDIEMEKSQQEAQQQQQQEVAFDLFSQPQTAHQPWQSAQKQASLKEKSVENILKGIENSKAIPFERVLYAIGIRYAGEVTAKYLARYFGSIEQVQQASLEELTQVEEVGEKVAQSIFDFFKDRKNTAIIARLKASGLQMETTLGVAAENGILKDKTFVVSGIFSVSRDDIKRKVEENGGKISSSISSKTDYVLAGENMGPEKKKKAEKLGVAILSEQEFYALLK